jgi:hypothetical protein
MPQRRGPRNRPQRREAPRVWLSDTARQRTGCSGPLGYASLLLTKVIRLTHVPGVLARTWTGNSSPPWWASDSSLLRRCLASASKSDRLALVVCSQPATCLPGANCVSVPLPRREHFVHFLHHRFLLHINYHERRCAYGHHARQGQNSQVETRQTKSFPTNHSTARSTRKLSP